MTEFEVTEKIKAKLKESGHNYRWLALQTEITECNISLYFTGKRRPGIDNLAKMCKALNISADWVLGLSETESIS